MILSTMAGVFRRRRRVMGACVLAMVIGGCNLDWEKPDLSTPLPEKFREGKAVSASPIAAGRDFVIKFGSKELAGLVDQALMDNLDIAAAAARIREADAQARMASSALYPNIALQDIARTNRAAGTTLNLANAATGFNTGSTSSSSLTPTTNRGRNYGFFQLGITAASYTLDFWGMNEDASYASRILANSSRFNRDVVEISTVAAIMNTYFEVLMAQDRLRIAHNNVAMAEKVNAAVQARFEAGIASIFDTSQQEAVVARQKATIPPLEMEFRQRLNVLAVLLGRTPESFSIKGGSLTKLKFPKIDPGLPSEVLLRRPDVAQAEAQLASQEFTVMQARAAFFPQLTLIGPYYGAQSALTSNLLSPQAMAWQAATQITQPIFDGYNLQGNYENTKGRYAELAALYRKQILTALSDTENALIAVKETGRRLQLQGDVVTASFRAFEAANMRMEGGTIDIVALSITQQDYFTALDVQCQNRFEYFQAATSLYQALGGGWSPTTRNAEIARANAAYDENKGPWP